MRNVWLAELVGTFALVFAGTGAIVVGQRTGTLSHVHIALVFGLVTAVLVYAFRPVSGAHFNPAVTIGLAAAGELPWARVPSYIAAQLTGAILASTVLRATFGSVGTLGETTPSIALFPALTVESVLTFILMLAIMSAAIHLKGERNYTGLVVGSAVALAALLGGPITGASMNPARSFGPALLMLEWDHHWIYWVAPLAGAVGAALLFRYGIQHSRPREVLTADFAGRNRQRPKLHRLS